MKRALTLLIIVLASVSVLSAQVYVEQFDGSGSGFTSGAGTFSFAEGDGELTITGTSTGPWDVFTYQLNDGSMPMVVDATENNKLYVRAKASNVGTQLRMDIEDANGYVTSLASVTKTLTTDFMVLEYDFTGLMQDGGYGGTACSADDAPCPVDGTQSSQLVFFVNPGVGGFNGSVVIDYISFGEEADGVIMSDIFQEHFEQDSSVNSFSYIGEGYTLTVADSELTINGDGTTPTWDPVELIFRTSTLDTIDLDVTGNNKLYVRVKSSIPNTAFRLDLLDVDGFVTTAGSITKILTTEFQTIEYDYTGAFFDLGYGGTPCTADTAPCPVNGERISNVVMHINPGESGFLGDITIDYFSFGIPLEPAGPEADLIYEDHFGNETLEFVGDNVGLVSAEMGSEWIITGDGTAGQYAPVSYLLHDKDLGEEIFLDMTPAQNKAYMRVRASQDNVPVRLDLIDTAGYITNLAGLTKVASTEWQIFEYDFTGNFLDGGFGGTPCPDGTTCEVDPGSIKQILVYPDPVQGAFNGEVYIDFFSIGQPLGEDAGPTGIINYSDQMDDNTSLFITDASGLTTTVADDIWSIAGDGTNGPWTPVVYDTHNDLGELALVDAVGSADVLYVRARSTVDAVLRVDLQDIDDFVTNAAAQTNNITAGEEYEIYEFSYINAYQDGGFGGSPCTSDTAPCPVDGQRIRNLQFFLNPGEGAYNGTLDIDWVAFGSPLTGVQNPEYLQSLRAFPNPTYDVVRLDYHLLQNAQVQVQVFNTMGQALRTVDMYQQGAGQQYAAIDLSNLSTGLYVVQVLVDGVSAGNLRVLKQ